MSKKPKSKTKIRSGGALTFIFVCLLVSAFFRFGGSESAIAKEVAAFTAGSKDKPVQLASEIAECKPVENPGPLLQAIRDRQALLEARESRLADRIQALKVAEQSLKENIGILLAAEQKLAATLTIADAAAEKDLKSLTSVYENMKSKNAANLFGEMAPEFAAGFLGRMRSDSAAGIMSNLTPEKAYKISLILAGRNARAPAK